MKKLVSVVIPAYNEEETIGLVLDDLYKVIKSLKEYNFEVIVVDNNSKDKTSDISRKYNAEVIFEKKKGKGRALAAGFKYAKGDIIVMLDADYSHIPEEIPTFLKKIENGYGLVIGSRLLGGSEEYTKIRAFGNIALSMIFWIVFGKNLTDALNGFKVFKKELIKDYTYKSKDFEIEIELISNALKSGLNIGEIISHERARAGGKKKSSIIIHGTKFFLMIIKEGIKHRLKL